MGKRKRWRDPFADYVEWTNNRYNPGHYLGGNLPPHLRKSSLGPNGRRLAGMLLGVSAAVMLGSVLMLAGFLREVSPLQTVLSVALVLLAVSAARVMYRAGKTGRHRRQRRDARDD